MDVRDVVVSSRLHECLKLLLDEKACPVDHLTVSEVRWLKSEFGGQLKKVGGYIYLEV